MAAELVEAKVSERRRRRRHGETGPGGSGPRAERRLLPARNGRRAVGGAVLRVRAGGRHPGTAPPPLSAPPRLALPLYLRAAAPRAGLQASPRPSPFPELFPAVHRRSGFPPFSSPVRGSGCAALPPPPPEGQVLVCGAQEVLGGISQRWGRGAAHMSPPNLCPFSVLGGRGRLGSS